MGAYYWGNGGGVQIQPSHPFNLCESGDERPNTVRDRVAPRLLPCGLWTVGGLCAVVDPEDWHVFVLDDGHKLEPLSHTKYTYRVVDGGHCVR